MAHTGLIGQGLNVTNGAEMSIIDDNQLVLCMTILYNVLKSIPNKKAVKKYVPYILKSVFWHKLLFFLFSESLKYLCIKQDFVSN